MFLGLEIVARQPNSAATAKGQPCLNDTIRRGTGKEEETSEDDWEARCIGGDSEDAFGGSVFSDGCDCLTCERLPRNALNVASRGSAMGILAASSLASRSDASWRCAQCISPRKNDDCLRSFLSSSLTASSGTSVSVDCFLPFGEARQVRWTRLSVFFCYPPRTKECLAGRRARNKRTYVLRLQEL